MTFEAMLAAAQSGDAEALSALVGRFAPLIAKSSHVYGVHDEDLEQEVIATFMNCVRCFNLKMYS